MTLEYYIEALQSFVKTNPKAKDFTVITAIDDEGNGYHEIFWDPSLGEYDGEGFMMNEEGEDPREYNAVCVN